MEFGHRRQPFTEAQRFFPSAPVTIRESLAYAVAALPARTITRKSFTEPVKSIEPATTTTPFFT